MSPAAGVTLQIDTPRVFAPLLENWRYKGLKGGRGAGRSNFLAELMVEVCLEPGTRAVCLREHQVTLEQSVKRLLEDKITKHHLNKVFRVLDTEIIGPGGGIIIFKGLKSYTADSIKSLEGYRYAWVEEAQTLSQRSLDLLRPTIRAEGPNWISELWFSWNPGQPTDPIEQLLCGAQGPPPRSCVIHSTYRDNPWFPNVLRSEMEYDRARDFEKYQHIWEGGYEQKSEARVFKNWRIDRFETPTDGTAFFVGGDWGFSQDPTVLVRCWIKDRALYVDAELYRIGVEIDHIPQFFDSLIPDEPQWARSLRIIADSARPETISYLQRHGYPKIQAAVKGQESVKEGVIFLQGYDIIVHERCTHTIDELRHYSYKTDKLTNLVLMPNVLEDKKNHVIDSLRYAVEPLRKPKQWVVW